MNAEYMEALKTFDLLQLSDDEINDNLAALNLEFDDKIINIAAYSKNIESEQAQLKTYIADAKDRLESMQRNVERLHSYMLTSMEVRGLKRVHSTEFDVKIQKSPPHVVVIDETLIEPEYFKEEIVFNLDKSKIRQELLNGSIVDGAKLESRLKLTIK
jgi:hypothetical protein